MSENINPSEISCGWFNPKTGESGSFVSKKQEQEYNSLPWYKKIFRLKPTAKVTHSNPYLPPEFYKQVKYRQNYIESGIFARARQFSIDGVVNVFIEKNKYEMSLNKYFYYDEDDNKVYIDAKALESGVIVEIPV